MCPFPGASALSEGSRAAHSSILAWSLVGYILQKVAKSWTQLKDLVEAKFSKALASPFSLGSPFLLHVTFVLIEVLK